MACFKQEDKEEIIWPMSLIIDYYYLHSLEDNFDDWCFEVIQDDAKEYPCQYGVSITRNLAIKKACIFQALGNYAKALREQRKKDREKRIQHIQEKLQEKLQDNNVC